MPLNQQWTAESIPPELAAIHDAPGGTSLRGLAEILNEYDQLKQRSDMGRCPKCETAIIRFDPPIEVTPDETLLCGAFKPGTYGGGMDVPVCLLKQGHDPDEMHWGVVEYETRWTDGGIEWMGKA